MTHKDSIIVLDNMLATKTRIKYMLDKQNLEDVSIKIKR
jgi:hypothetical protein